MCERQSDLLKNIFLFFGEVPGIHNSLGIGRFEELERGKCLVTLTMWMHRIFGTWFSVLSCHSEACLESHSFQYLPSILYWDNKRDLPL